MITGSKIVIAEASNCEIFGDEVTIELAVGCAVSGRRVEIESAGPRRNSEMLVYVQVKDVSGHDKELAALAEQDAALAAELDKLKTEHAARWRRRRKCAPIWRWPIACARASCS
ncbi:hypothetical protein ACHMW6_22960 [Pseudoduganella sp. UC29_106]|uniref:hypothetical protein n=1 Tax=Pseudoduganella sp. UC29_106 TaxID=3374553 RepID=UPI003756600A